MFKYIGGAVVYGFAFYGLGKFLERQTVKVVYVPDLRKNAGETATDRPVDGAGAPTANSVGGEGAEGVKAAQGNGALSATKLGVANEH